MHRFFDHQVLLFELGIPATYRIAFWQCDFYFIQKKRLSFQSPSSIITNYVALQNVEKVLLVIQKSFQLPSSTVYHFWFERPQMAY